MRGAIAAGGLRDWLGAAGITTGRVFRAVDRHGHFSAGLSGEAVAMVVRRRAELADEIERLENKLRELEAAVKRRDDGLKAQGERIAKLERENAALKVEVTRLRTGGALMVGSLPEPPPTAAEADEPVVDDQTAEYARLLGQLAERARRTYANELWPAATTAAEREAVLARRRRGLNNSARHGTV